MDVASCPLSKKPLTTVFQPVPVPSAAAGDGLADQPLRRVGTGRDPHIAFVISHPYVDALACFREPIKLLAERGWQVDLYTTLSPEHPAPSFHRANVRLRPMEMTRAGALRMMWQLLTHRPRYRWIFAIPQWSLHYAGMAARLARIPMACISDELIAEAELSTAEERKWKGRERRAHQRCALTIALSDERAEFIRAENRLGAAHPIHVVPNAPPGPAARLRSRYYHDALGIPADHRIVLHAGSLWWQPALELAEIAQRWNGRWHLVFQGRMGAQMRDRRNGERVHFNQTVLASQLLDYAISSADIGLALYPSERCNDRLMGTASGKIGLYLKNALPVIASAQPCFHWLEETGCGVCVSDVAEIESAAERIWAQYEAYVERVVAGYAILDFRHTFAPVEERLRRAGR